MIEDVDATAVVIRIERSEWRRDWLIHARVISVKAMVSAERALVGVPLHITFAGMLLPHLALKSGLLFRVARRRALLVPTGHHHEHAHRHGHGHDHQHGGGHDHPPADWRSLLPLGLAGGLVPSPSAIVGSMGLGSSR